MELRCLADISGPFFDRDRPFRNWSSFPFYQTDLPEKPYVDLALLERGVVRAMAHLEELKAQGYTGIVIDNLAHLVSFGQLRTPVYAPDSPYAIRARYYRVAFGRLFDRAASLGMEVFVTTDMQWSTPPVRRFVGRFAPGSTRLATLNRAAVEELFTLLPQVSGLVVRVGEAGGAHNQGNDYAGHMIYTSPRDLRGLIDDLLPVCVAHDRLLVVRTWSVGIGELGDLICSPERYDETFGDLHSAHLLVSVKHTPGDFFRRLPPNPTLGLLGPRQIIELQNRREYELFGMVPSAITELHQAVVQRAISNPRYAGVWAWNSTGGWGGGRAALGKQGWSIWTELSSALTAALAHDPALDAGGFVQRWCRQRFAEPFAVALANFYLDSADLIEQGWYPTTAQPAPRIGPIMLPPLLWVWWMRPTAALPVWAYLTAEIGDIAGALAESARAEQRAADYATRLAALAPDGDARAAEAVAGAAYLHSALAVADAIRRLMLPLMEAAWEGNRNVWHQVALKAPDVSRALSSHRARWANDSDRPPLELEELEELMATLERAPLRLWSHALLACTLVRGVRAASKRVAGKRVAGGLVLAMLLVTLASQGRVSLIGATLPLLLAITLRRKLVGATLPWLSRRLYLLPSIFFEAGPSFTEWAR